MNLRLPQLSLGAKIATAPLLAIVFLLLLAAASWWAGQQVASHLRAVRDERLPAQAFAQDLRQQVQAVNTSLYRSLAWEGAGVDRGRIDKLDAEIAERFKAAGSALAERRARSTGATAAQLDTVAQALAKLQHQAADTLDMKSTGLANAATFISLVEQSERRLNALLAAWVSEREAEVQADFGAVLATLARMSVVLTALMGVAVLGTAAATAWCVRRLLHTLGLASERARRLADGDLRETPAAPRSADAAGQMLQALTRGAQAFRGAVQEIHGAAGSVQTAASEIAAGNLELSGRTERCAAALQQQAEQLALMAASVQRGADSAASADRAAAAAAGTAHAGKDAMDELVRTMAAVNARAERMREIVGTIDAIAFQTNLLSLNASVEAARAGPQGRGFAVVAGEVRSLAQRSAGAAHDIRGLIGDALRGIGQGNAQVGEAQRRIAAAESAIRGVSEMVSGVAGAADEQADGIVRLRGAIGELDSATQHNAALVEQAAAAAESLREQATRLVAAVGRFRTGSDGECVSDGAAAGAAASPPSTALAGEEGVDAEFAGEKLQHTLHAVRSSA